MTQMRRPALQTPHPPPTPPPPPLYEWLGRHGAAWTAGA